MRRVITYGTFDTLHYGHIKLIQRAKLLGDHLTVGLSTDDFNKKKGKTSLQNFEERKSIISSLKEIDLIIEEQSWHQKIYDIKNLRIDVFAMGSDWCGKFDAISDHCEVQYIERNPEISSSAIKRFITHE